MKQFQNVNNGELVCVIHLMCIFGKRYPYQSAIDASGNRLTQKRSQTKRKPDEATSCELKENETKGSGKGRSKNTTLVEPDAPRRGPAM